jgi:hypothetical protein
MAFTAFRQTAAGKAERELRQHPLIAAGHLPEAICRRPFAEGRLPQAN